jgi:hypothetical protein
MDLSPGCSLYEDTLVNIEHALHSDIILDRIKANTADGKELRGVLQLAPEDSNESSVHPIQTRMADS